MKLIVLTVDFAYSTTFGLRAYDLILLMGIKVTRRCKLPLWRIFLLVTSSSVTKLYSYQ